MTLTTATLAKASYNEANAQITISGKLMSKLGRGEDNYSLTFVCPDEVTPARADFKDLSLIVDVLQGLKRGNTAYNLNLDVEVVEYKEF